MKTRLLFFIVLLSCVSAFAQKQKMAGDDIAQKFTDAAMKGDVEILKSMCARGVNINIEPSGNKGWTALMAATTFGQTGTVKFLIANGADVKVKLKDGETVLYQSAQNENNKEIVEALLKAGVEINVQTKEERTALLRFAWMSEADAVKLLLDAGADAKIKDKDGWTAFHFACYSGDGETVKQFLAYGENPNGRDEQGKTPLMWAGWSDRRSALPVLIAAGADVNSKDNDGATPLMIAASHFYYDEVKIFLDAKADVSAQDKNGWNALMHAASSRFLSDEIGAHGKGMFRWLAATKIIEDLIAAGTAADVNAQNAAGDTALILAVKADNAHFAETLLKNGANPNVKNKAGKTAKNYAGKDYDKRRDVILKMSDRINKNL